MLRDRAAPLRAYINRDLGWPFFPNRSSAGLTEQQMCAMSWSLAIASCLNREMALHARCGACFILMGPGHIEEGIEEFCTTHTESVGSESVGLGNSGADLLEWIAGQAAH